jgi:hypothetical protein
MRIATIIREIDSAVFQRRGTIGEWSIGVTDDPDGMRHAMTASGFDISRWHQWEADTTSDALAVGNLFVTLGMNGSGLDETPSTSATVFVFIASHSSHVDAAIRQLA